LRSNISNPEINQKILFDTNTYNINQSDIIMVDWDFGDEVKTTNTTLTMEHSYTKAGKKVVSQTIHLTDGKQIINMITLYVINTTDLASYALHMKPSTLIANK
jgi:PKD repeat protein